MIFLIAALAFAQQNSEFVGAGRDCQLPAAIYGTSGWANAEQALDTNASTYSAAAFAERLGLDQPAMLEGRTRGFLVWEVNQTYAAARVPVFHGEFGLNYAGDTNCDPQYRVGLRPVDLQATVLAGAFGTEHFGGFFAASQTSGQVASADMAYRAVVLGYLYPLYSTLLLPFAPFLSGEYRSGGGGFGLEAVYGVWVDTDWVLAKAGYAKSNGLYATARETTFGVFATVVVRPNDASIPVFRAGMQKFDPTKLGDGAPSIGMPSLFYRDIPLAQPVGVDEIENLEHQRHRTTHLQLDDVGRSIDLVSTFRLRPEPGVSEALVAVHSRAYHQRAGDESHGMRGWGFARGGVVTLLEQPSLGVAGGPVPSLRVETGFRSSGASVWIHLQLNDAEQLALYPFARNAVSTQLHVEITKW